MVDQEISQHRAAEGSDERCHHRVSQGRAPLSQNRKCERFWTLPVRTAAKRYSFIVSDLHRLLVTGLPAHCERFCTTSFLDLLAVVHTMIALADRREIQLP